MGTNHANRIYFEQASVLIPQFTGSSVTLHQDVSSGTDCQITDQRRAVADTIRGQDGNRITNGRRNDADGIVEHGKVTMEGADCKPNGAFGLSAGQLYGCRTDSMAMENKEDDIEHFQALLEMQEQKIAMDRHATQEAHHKDQDNKGSIVNEVGNDNPVEVSVGMGYDNMFMFNDLFVLNNHKNKKNPYGDGLFEAYSPVDVVPYHHNDDNLAMAMTNESKNKRKMSGQRQRIYQQTLNQNKDVSPLLFVPHSTPADNSPVSIKYSIGPNKQISPLEYTDNLHSSPSVNGVLYEPPPLDTKPPVPTPGHNMHHMYGMMPMILPVEDMAGSPQLSINAVNKMSHPHSPAVVSRSCCDTGSNPPTIADVKSMKGSVALQDQILPAQGHRDALDDTPQLPAQPATAQHYSSVDMSTINSLKRRRLKSKRRSRKRDPSEIEDIAAKPNIVAQNSGEQQMFLYPRIAQAQCRNGEIIKAKGFEQDPSSVLTVYPDASAPTPKLVRIVEQMKIFLVTAPIYWNPDQKLKRFYINNDESISCILWNNYFYITGTDIVRSLKYRFCAFGRPVKNMKKFEEGIFSDLRNLKPGFESTLESSHSEFLRYLYKGSCIKTQKKQKVFHWFSVPHDRLFMDALERDFKREALGIEPTSTPLIHMPLAKALEQARSECLVSLANHDLFCGPKNRNMSSPSAMNPTAEHLMALNNVNRVEGVKRREESSNENSDSNEPKTDDPQQVQQNYCAWENM